MQLTQQTFNIEQIERNILGFKNSRTSLGDLSELRRSIVENGLLNPPIVWGQTDGNGVERLVLLAGHRRFQAILDERADREQNGGSERFFDTVDCGVYDGTIEGALALNISENIQREDLNYADMCESVAKLNERIGNQTETARLLNISQPQVSILCSTYRGLCSDGFEAMRQGRIRLNQAKRLAKITNQDGTPNVARQMELLEAILADVSEGIPEEEQRRRAKTFRSKSEVEELRTVLSREEAEGDLQVDEDHRRSVMQVIRWFFLELDTENMLVRVDEMDDTSAEEVDGDDSIRRRRRIRIGE
jgi:ParB-like chromosome segregation protein Spo0J